MLGRVADIQRFCMHDGPGIRTVVFLQGCPLRCGYCHNPEMQPIKGGTLLSVEQVSKEVARDLLFYRSGGGGLTLSGGEPLMQPEFSVELLRSAEEMGIDTCVETSGAGTISDVRRLAKMTRLFLWDIKAAAPIADGQMEKLTAAEASGSKIRLRSVLVKGVEEELLRKRLCQAARKLADCRGVELLPHNVLAKAKISGSRNGFLLPIE